MRGWSSGLGAGPQNFGFRVRISRTAVSSKSGNLSEFLSNRKDENSNSQKNSKLDDGLLISEKNIDFAEDHSKCGYLL